MDDGSDGVSEKDLGAANFGRWLIFVGSVTS